MSYLCEFCNKSFKTKWNLKNHQENTKYCLSLRNNNTTEIKNFECQFCNKNLTTKFKLESHQKICRSQDLYRKFKDVQNKYTNLKLITDEQLKNKDNEIVKLTDIVLNLQYQIKELATIAIDKPNTINNNHNLNNNSNNKMIDNRVLNMIHLDLNQ